MQKETEILQFLHPMKNKHLDIDRLIASNLLRILEREGVSQTKLAKLIMRCPSFENESAVSCNGWLGGTRVSGDRVRTLDEAELVGLCADVAEDHVLGHASE